MSDNSDADQQTIQKKQRKPRVLTDAHREKLIANVAKARAIRVTKSKERKEGRMTDELIMKEIIEEKKRAKIFGVEDEQHSDSTSKPQKSKSRKEPVVESSESEQSEPEISDDDEESADDQESESASETSSSDDDAEFVLKRKKATTKKPSQVKVQKMPTKKEKQSKKEAESILAKMAAMTAEIAALKKEKRKQSKVNVYVNQPEKKEMSAQKRMELLDL